MIDSVKKFKEIKQEINFLFIGDFKINGLSFYYDFLEIASKELLNNIKCYQTNMIESLFGLDKINFIIFLCNCLNIEPILDQLKKWKDGLSTVNAMFYGMVFTADEIKMEKYKEFRLAVHDLHSKNKVNKFTDYATRIFFERPYIIKKITPYNSIEIPELPLMTKLYPEMNNEERLKFNVTLAETHALIHKMNLISYEFQEKILKNR